MEFKSWKTCKCEFKPGKPVKYIYPNQDLVKKKFVEFIIPFFEKYCFFKKVWIWGSLSRSEFGIYESNYNGKEASDIDLLVLVDRSCEIPVEFNEMKKWTETRTYSRAFFSNLIFEVKLKSGKVVKHTIDFICHWPELHTKKGFYSKVEDSELIYGT